MEKRVAKDCTNDYRAAYFETMNQAMEWRKRPLALSGDGADELRIQNRKDYLRHSVGACNWYRTSNPALWTRIPA